MTTSKVDTYYQRDTIPEEQILYDHLLSRVQKESPTQLLEDFRHLFIEARGYKDVQVYSALEKIAKAKDAQQHFNFFFNRCCHILINHWQIQSQFQTVMPELIGLFENLASARQGSYNTANRVRQLVKNYTQTDQYIKLERLARVTSTKQNGNSNTVNSVGNLIHRYPYLYDHCLLGEDSSYEHQKTVRRIKSKTERCFEVNLSRYVTYKVRLAQISHSSTSAEEEQMIQPVNNPTLLSDRELNKSLKHYLGKVENGHTYRSLSHRFLNHTTHTQTYQAFKNDLYEYLVGSIDLEYGKGQFNQKLHQLLENTFPHCNHQKPNEFLIMRTSSQLLNFLVVESAYQPNHYVFIDLLTNMGVTRTIGILLKVVLMCHKVKPYLEKRFSILFGHYESSTKDGVPWLIKSLENLHLAFSIHFGKTDLSCLKSLS